MTKNTYLLNSFLEEKYLETDVTVADGGSFNDRFEKLEEMGKGRFGHVHKVVEKSTGQILAAKFVKCIKVKDKEKVKLNVVVRYRYDLYYYITNR